MNTPKLTEIVQLLKPIKINNDGLEEISYEPEYVLMANIQVFSPKSIRNMEQIIQGAELSLPMYSVYFNVLLDKMTHEYRVKWRKTDYEVLTVQISSLGAVPTTSLIIRALPNG